MSYLWDNSIRRVVLDGGQAGEVLMPDDVLLGDEGSLFRMSDLEEGRLARVYDSVLGIVIREQGFRHPGTPHCMVFVVFGTLDRADSWVPLRSVEFL